MNRDHPKKAYRNIDFLTSPPARMLRILAEYEEPRHRFRKNDVRDTIVFFGSARAKSPEQLEAAIETAGGRETEAARKVIKLSESYNHARELAHRLTEWSQQLGPEGRNYLIATGGGPGIMEAANRGASEAGGPTVGLGISLHFEEQLNPYVTPELAFEFHYFFMRKYWFIYLAKAVVAFPGGMGTLDEVLEALTLVQTKKIKKPLPIVLFGREYWTKVLHFEELEEWGTISPDDRALFYICDTVDQAFSFLTQALENAQSFPLKYAP